MRLPNPTAIFPPVEMPLRDAMRGVSALADAGEDFLEPMAGFMPPPVRRSARRVQAALARAGTRILTSGVGLDEIAAAARHLAGETGDGATARVLAFAWERLHRTRPGTEHQMISETLLAPRLSQLLADETGTAAERAAALVLGLRASAIIGFVPGVAAQHSKGEQGDIDAVLIAALVWLLALRGADLAEEDRLLELSLVLVDAFWAELATLLAAERVDRAALALQLHALAEHL